jgi:hypothetical protein
LYSIIITNFYIEKTHWHLLQKEQEGGEAEDTKEGALEEPAGCKSWQRTQKEQV